MDYLSRSMSSVPEQEKKLSRSFINNNDLMRKYLSITSAKNESSGRNSSGSDRKKNLFDLSEQRSHLDVRGHDFSAAIDKNNSCSFISELAQVKSNQSDARSKNQFNSGWTSGDSDSSNPDWKDITHTYKRFSNDKLSMKSIKKKVNLPVSTKLTEKSIFDINSNHKKDTEIDFSITLDLGSDDDLDCVPDQLRSEPTRSKSPINYDAAPLIHCPGFEVDKPYIPSLVQNELSDSDSSVICPKRPSFSSIQNFNDLCDKIPLLDCESEDSENDCHRSKTEELVRIGQKSETKTSDNDRCITDRSFTTPISHSDDDFFISNRNKILVKSDENIRDSLSKHLKSQEKPRWKSQVDEQKSSFLRADAFISKFTSRDDVQVDRQPSGKKSESNAIPPKHPSSYIPSQSIQSQSSAFRTFKAADVVTVSNSSINKSNCESKSLKSIDNIYLGSLPKINQHKLSGSSNNSIKVLSDTLQLTESRKSSMKNSESRKFLSQLDAREKSRIKDDKFQPKKSSRQITKSAVSNVISKSTENLLLTLGDNLCVQDPPAIDIQGGSKDDCIRMSKGLKARNSKESVSPAIMMEESFIESETDDNVIKSNNRKGNSVLFDLCKNVSSKKLSPHTLNATYKADQTKTITKPVIQVNKTSSTSKNINTNQNVAIESLFRPISRNETPNPVKMSGNVSSLRSTDASSKMELEQIFCQSKDNSKKNSLGSFKRALTPFAQRASGEFIERNIKGFEESDSSKKESGKTMNLSVTLVEETSSSLSISNEEDRVNDNNLEVASRHTVSSSSSSSDSSFLSRKSSQRSQKLNFTRFASTDANNNTLEGKKSLIKNASPSVLSVSKPSKTYCRKAVEKPHHQWFLPTVNNKKSSKPLHIDRPIKKKKLFHLQSNYKESSTSPESFLTNPTPMTNRNKVDRLQKGLFDITELDESSEEEPIISENIEKSTNSESNIGAYFNSLRRSNRIKQKINYKELSDTEPSLLSNKPNAGIKDINPNANQIINSNKCKNTGNNLKTLNSQQDKSKSSKRNSKTESQKAMVKDMILKNITNTDSGIKNSDTGNGNNKPLGNFTNTTHLPCKQLNSKSMLENEVSTLSKKVTTKTKSSKSLTKDVFDFSETDPETTVKQMKNKSKNKTVKKRARKKIISDVSDQIDLTLDENEIIGIEKTGKSMNQKRQESSSSITNCNNRAKRRKTEKNFEETREASPSDSLSSRLRVRTLKVYGTVHHPETYEPGIVIEIPTNNRQSSNEKTDTCGKAENESMKTVVSSNALDLKDKVISHIEVSNKKSEQIGSLANSIDTDSTAHLIRSQTRSKSREGKFKTSTKVQDKSFETTSKNLERKSTVKNIMQIESSDLAIKEQENIFTVDLELPNENLEIVQVEKTQLSNLEANEDLKTDNVGASANAPTVKELTSNKESLSSSSLPENHEINLINSLETVNSSINNVMMLLGQLNNQCKQHQELIQTLTTIVQSKEKT